MSGDAPDFSAFDYTTMTEDDYPRLAQLREHYRNERVASALESLKPRINDYFIEVMCTDVTKDCFARLPEDVPISRYLDAVRGLLNQASPETKKHVKARAYNNCTNIRITFTPIESPIC